MLAKEKRTWCPGCGNFIILKAIDDILNAGDILDIRNTVVVSGIGQAAKMPHHLSPCNGFAGLHGRSIPNATGIKIANHKLDVILFSGDGDLLAEGGNHLIHAIRRNINITCFLHDNQVYGLTKGQASPTMWKDAKTKIQYGGVKYTPLNPIPMALSLGVTFAARTSVSDHQHLKKTMREAIKHQGFSLVQIMQTCPSYNKERDLKWYKENTTYLETDYDCSDVNKAIISSSEISEKIKLGTFYKSESIPYELNNPVSDKNLSLVERGFDFSFGKKDLEKLINNE